MTAFRAIVVCAAAALAAFGAPAGAQLAAGKLKVCADPNNLPFSNRAEEGFENKLARLWAREAGVELEYTWFPQRRGFERNTLNAEDLERGGYKCDVIVGVPAGYDLALTTRPYYRSTYALVYVAGGKLDVANALDLATLPPATRDALRIGVFTPGPAAEWLARHGLYDQMVPYPALGGDPDVYPGKIIENELLTGERREGLYGGLWSIAEKTAAGVGLGLSMLALDVAGYVPNQAQTPLVLDVLRAIYIGVPCVCMAAGFVIALRYPLDREAHRAITAELAERS